MPSQAVVTRRALAASALLAAAPEAGARKRTRKQPKPEVLIHVIVTATDTRLIGGAIPGFEVLVDIAGIDFRIDPPAVFSLKDFLLPIVDGLPTPARIADTFRTAFEPPGGPGRIEVEIS